MRRNRSTARSGGNCSLKSRLDLLSGAQYLSELMNHDDPLESLTIVEQHQGKLKKAVNESASKDIKIVVQFLKFLGSEPFNVGLAKDSALSCYVSISGIPRLLLTIENYFDTFDRNDRLSIAWFLVAVSKDDADFRNSPPTQSLTDKLAADPEADAVRALLGLIRPEYAKTSHYSEVPFASTTTEGAHNFSVNCVEHLQSLEPQHDNDFPFDYRKIRIVPTVEELNSNLECRSAVPIQSVASTVPLLLNRQFRLLREDMLCPMRKEIKEQLLAPDSKKSRIFKAPRVEDVLCDGVSCVMMTVKAPLHLLTRMRNMKANEQKDFFEIGAGKRVLTRDSVLVFVTKGKVVSIGRVVRRKKEEFLVKEEDLFRIGVAFDDKQLLGDMLAQLSVPFKGGENAAASASSNSTEGKRHAQARHVHGSEQQVADEVFQASASLFSYQPVLECLRSMDDVPFREEIVEQALPLPLNPIVPIPEQVRRVLTADPSQLHAVESALSRRVSLIQGPPGTGKTFVGVQIVRALLHSADLAGTQLRILCLCCTNHALDDFLLSLHHEAGVPLRDIRRLGRSPKIHEDLRSCTLEEQAETMFNRLQSINYAIIMKGMEKCEKQVKHLKNELSKRSRQWGVKWWQTVEQFLTRPLATEDQRAAYAQLSVLLAAPPKAASASSGAGMKTVGKKGKAIDGSYFWSEWFAGKGRPNLPAGSSIEPGRIPGIAPPSSLNIWALDKPARRALIAEWQDEYKQPIIENMLGEMGEYQYFVHRKELLRSETKVQPARAARVLGCTTTSAAKQRELLAQIKPDVVIVEEAAEILEANVITSLGPSVKQLVMIGDHKQLRPKLEHYTLRKEANRGVDFDVSLFERMALQPDFPVVTLEVQHRMRPAISRLIRLNTYPNLVDHDNVKGRDHIRGVSQNVIFINHSQSEAADEERLALGTNSKVNPHEVDMVREIVRYFLQQRYKAEDIVVLTPYLGQLVLIQKALRDVHVAVNIEDQDRSDLRKFDIDVPAGGAGGAGRGIDKKKGSGPDSSDDSASEVEPSRSPAIRVATVDNFQGEEARIIVASLVRCNSDGDIGFVSGPERVNVLLSRARDGMVLLGSEDTLCNCRNTRGRDMWTGIFQNLRDQGSVFDGFPALCYTHKRPPRELLDAPDKFARCVPCGGCTEPCKIPLPTCPMGHRCKQQCHLQIDPATKADVHLSMDCTEMVPEKCTAGHPVTRKCCESSAAPCIAKVFDTCTEGHKVARKCSDPKRPDCPVCVKIAHEEQRRQKEQQALIEARAKELAEELRKSQKLLHLLEDERNKQEHTNTLARIRREQKLRQEEIDCLSKKFQRADLDSAINRASDATVHANTTAVATTPGSATGATAAGTTTAGPATGATAAGAGTAAGTATAGAATGAAGATAACVGVASVGARAGSGVTAGATNGATTGATAGAAATTVAGSSAATADALPSAGTFAATTGANGASSTLNVDSEPSISNSDSLSKIGHKKLGVWIQLAAKHEWLKLHEQLAATGLVLASNNCLSRFDKAIHKVMICLIDIGLDQRPASQQLLDKLEPLDRELRLESGSKLDGPFLQLGRALHLYACFMAAAADSNLRCTAKDYAQKLLAHSRSCSRGDALPDAWLTNAKCWVEDGVTATPSGVNGKGPSIRASRVPNSAAHRWGKCQEEFQAAATTGAKLSDGKTAAKASPSASVDTLLKMTGLERVKSDIVGLYEQFVIAKEQKASVSASYNIRCDGNPGTGKTTVARLYASFLREIGILPEKSEVKETSGSKLITDGVRGLTSVLESMKEVGGGAIFVDEAYQLNPQTEQAGRQVLDFLLPHAEKLQGEYGKIVWIFAGYKNNMDKLFEHNPGLPSRFPSTMSFDDYTDPELLSILEGLLNRAGADVSPPVSTTSDKAAAAGTASGKGAGTKKSPANRALPMYRSGSAYYDPYGPQKADEHDEWGNTWRWDAPNYTFEDDHGNITGYGASNLGTYQNPVVSRDTETMWIFNRVENTWVDRDDPAKSQKHFPGTAAPVPKQEKVDSPPFHASDPKWLRVAIGRIGRRRGTVGFGNARAVRVLFDISRRRQSERLTALRRAGYRPDIMELTRDDLLGPKADKDQLEACDAWIQLQQMEGLQEVKSEVHKLIQLAVTNSDMEDAEKPIRDISLNRIFLGNPGTGKTTVAQLYGKILQHLGLLSKGDVILKNPSDFIGSVLGSSEQQTRTILSQAEGCVLVIDEAYSLNPSTDSVGGSGSQDPYKSAVIDTIVEQVQSKPGDDRAVLLLGYRVPMEALMKAANPGLARRFQLENAFEFTDYDDEALLKILLKKCAKAGLTLDLDTATFAIKQLAKARAMPSFGNAGSVENLLGIAKMNLQQRASSSDVLCKEDFCRGGVLPVEGREEDIFADLVGCDKIIAKLSEFRDTIELSRLTGKDPKENCEWNYLFVGAPGTGKTTVARKMGKMFHSLGLLPMDDVVEIKAVDLVTGYVGQAAKKATEVLHSARGKVLFIDEAYQLNPSKGGPYMQEAVDALVQGLTSLELKNNLVVILAGYEREIDDTLLVNPGLRSRFSEKLHFENFSVGATEQMLRLKIMANNLIVDPLANEALNRIAQQLTQIPKFGNGRDVETLAKRVFKAAAKRLHASKLGPDVSLSVTEDDLTTALETMMMVRAPVAGNPDGISTGHNGTANLPHPPLQYESAYQRMIAPPPPATAVNTALASAKSEDKEDGDGDADGGSSVDPFLITLQSLLDARELNSQEAVDRLSTSDLNSAEMLALAVEIATVLRIDHASAQNLLKKWQDDQATVREQIVEQLREVEAAKQDKRKALVPIWRCAVCGQADKPFIACYVSPFIVRYEEQDLQG